MSFHSVKTQKRFYMAKVATIIFVVRWQMKYLLQPKRRLSCQEEADKIMMSASSESNFAESDE